MNFHDYPVSANVSLLFADLPYLERFGAAAGEGFTMVESWWPFAVPAPPDDEIDALVAAIGEARVQLTGLNFWAGDMGAGERGVAGLPDREAELMANIPVVVDIAQRTGCRAFNLLYGRIDLDHRTEADDQAARMIAAAATAVAPIGGMVLIEPLAASINGTYPLHTLQDALAVIDGPLAGVANVGVLFDTFHLGSNGVDLPAAAAEFAGRIAHVQFADVEGRGEPGTGSAPLDETFETLRAHGYSGTVAAEYKPTRVTGETLGWATR